MVFRQRNGSPAVPEQATTLNARLPTRFYCRFDLIGRVGLADDDGVQAVAVADVSVVVGRREEKIFEQYQLPA